jgi:hypothetical protein
MSLLVINRTKLFRSVCHFWLPSGFCPNYSENREHECGMSALPLPKRVLVDRTDDEARTLFTNIRRAMAPQGRVLLADPDSRSPFGKLYDMLMLMVFGSRLRTEAEVQALLAQTGFRLTRAIETRASTTLRLLEGVPA